jgi:hypothetical protein
MLQDNYAVFEYVANRYAINNDYLELEQRIDQLQRQVDSLEILVDIYNEVEYNTTESQCEGNAYYVCYNDNFYYHIDSNDKIILLFGTYNVIAIQIILERQEDGDFYYTKIGMYDGSYNFDSDGFCEVYEVYHTTHYQSSAVSLIQHIIENADWTLFDGLEDWEDLKEQLGVEE